jgi:hypothetical protein
MWLCRQPPFHLSADRLLSGVLELLHADLPGEVMFEGEGTPRLTRTDILSPHPQQDQILKLYRLKYMFMRPAAISPPGELVVEHNV